MTDTSSPLPPHSAYLIQYDRACRFLRRLDSRTAPNLYGAVLAIAEYELDVSAFFMVCWHIWDWVKNDDTIPQATRDAVTAAAFATPPLPACHDLANGSKHYVLARPKLLGPGGKTVARSDIDLQQSEDGWGDGPTSWTFSCVFPDNTEHYVHDLAREALRAWDAVLNAHGLPTPGTDVLAPVDFSRPPP